MVCIGCSISSDLYLHFFSTFGAAMMRKFWHKYSILITLFVLFVTPLLAAIFAYQHGKHWINKTTNYGTFIQPPLSMSQLGFIKPNGAPLTSDNGSNVWLLVYLTENDCMQDCQKNLYKMRQVRLALGAEK